MALKPQLSKFLSFLQSKRAGEVVSAAEILGGTGWADSTFTTYLGKHHFDPFLKSKGSGFLILLNGNDVTERKVKEAFTQVKPSHFTPFEGWELNGQRAVYRLSRQIGAGAVGLVWRCSVNGGTEQVAAKIACPREDLLKQLDNVLKRFSRESKNPHSLSHPNVVVYRDYGEIDGRPFLIMSLADRSADDILKDEGPLSLESSLCIIECSLLGLEYLHGLGHIHRDVKPANMLECGGSMFVLGDLGIVRWSDMNPEFVSAGTITGASMQLGSWHYMAPEQRDAPHEVVPASDIYALGASWFELLAGANKIPDPARIAKGKFTPSTDNPEAATLIRKMLEYEPEDRPTVQAALETVRRLRSLH